MNDEEWFALHAEYLRSERWHFRRAAVLCRDRWMCQAQLMVCTGRAEQVHHKTYQHWRNEPLFDLVSVCANCHDELTRMDRENRVPLARLSRTERGDVPA